MRDDRLSRDKLSMPPGIKGILCIKFDLFKIKKTRHFGLPMLFYAFFPKNKKNIDRVAIVT